MFTKSPTIIINADDFGHTKGVTEGIIYAYNFGVVTSTTTLANLMTGEEPTPTKPKIDINKPALGIGVHLNNTYGPPILADRFKNHPFDRPNRNSGDDNEWMGSVWEEWFSKFDSKLIESEYEAQINKVINCLCNPDHLDSHNSAVSYEPIKSVFYRLAKKYNLPIRSIAPLSEKAEFGGDFINDQMYIDEARDLGIKTVDKIVMKYFFKEKNPQQSFFRSLESLKPKQIVEYMFHPSIDDSMGEWRLKDLELLTDTKTIKKIKDLNIRLSTYKEVFN